MINLLKTEKEIIKIFRIGSGWFRVKANSSDRAPVKVNVSGRARVKVNFSGWVRVQKSKLAQDSRTLLNSENYSKKQLRKLPN